MIKEREYLFSANEFKKPIILKNDRAIAMLIMRLLLLDPGSDPLHPDMGVGIRSYRYAMGKEEELKARIEDQMKTYLPCFPAGNVEFKVTPDKLLNIEITVNDTVYIYDSANAPVPIHIDDARE